MGGLADEQSTGARARLAALGASLGRLDIAAPAGASVSVAHMERAPAPLVVHVAPGQHAVRVDLPDGRTVTRSLTVAAGASASLGVEAPGAAPPSAKPKPGRGAVAVSSGGVSPQRVVAWTALGGAVVSSGAAVVLGLLTLDARDSFDEFGRRDPDLHDRAVALRTWTNVAWIGAGTLAAAGIVLLVTSPARTAASSPRSTSTPMLFGRF
jgi:hypothetical protein